LGDAIEACFDDERQSMLELTPEPWPLIPLNGPIGKARGRLSTVWVASGYARRGAARAEFGSGLGSNPRKRGERDHDQVSALRFQLKL